MQLPGLAARLLSQGGAASQGGSEGCAGSQLSRWRSASTTSIPVSPALQRGRQQGVAQVLGGVQLSLVSMTNFTASDLGQPGQWTRRDSFLSSPFSSETLVFPRPSQPSGRARVLLSLCSPVFGRTARGSSCSLLPVVAAALLPCGPEACVSLDASSCKGRASLGARRVRNLAAVQEMEETWLPSLGQEGPLEEGVAAHSNILAWRIPGQRSLVGYSPWGHKESDTPERRSAHTLGKDTLFLAPALGETQGADHVGSSPRRNSGCRPRGFQPSRSPRTVSSF